MNGQRNRWRRSPTAAGWTLSETLVAMIVAGVVFAAVMDGIALFNRYAGLRVRQITDSMRLWEGYRHLRDLTAAADSAALENGAVRLFRRGEVVAELVETDSLLVVRYGSRVDTLISGVSGFTLVGVRRRTGADTVRVVVGNPGAEVSTLSFPVAPPAHELVVRELREREKPYLYE